MKTRLQFIVIILALIAGKLFAQEALALVNIGHTKTASSPTVEVSVFEFRASTTDYDLNSISKDMIGEHFLGDQIARKLYLLDSKYTYQVEIVPGNPQTKTVVRKPVIYDAVQKIERHLKKSVKKGDVSIETATQEFNQVLDVAFNVLTADTDSFEKAISKTDDANSLTNLFTKQVKLIF